MISVTLCYETVTNIPLFKKCIQVKLFTKVDKRFLGYRLMRYFTLFSRKSRIMVLFFIGAWSSTIIWVDMSNHYTYYIKYRMQQSQGVDRYHELFCRLLFNYRKFRAHHDIFAIHSCVNYIILFKRWRKTVGINHLTAPVVVGLIKKKKKKKLRKKSIKHCRGV